MQSTEWANDLHELQGKNVFEYFWSVSLIQTINLNLLSHMGMIPEIIFIQFIWGDYK